MTSFPYFFFFSLFYKYDPNLSSTIEHSFIMKSKGTTDIRTICVNHNFHHNNTVSNINFFLLFILVIWKPSNTQLTVHRKLDFLFLFSNLFYRYFLSLAHGSSAKDKYKCIKKTKYKIILGCKETDWKWKVL